MGMRIMWARLLVVGAQTVADPIAAYATLEAQYLDFFKAHNFNLNPTVWQGRAFVEKSLGSKGLDNFRSGSYNAYVWQPKGSVLERFYAELTALPEARRMFQCTKEDGSFGVTTLNVRGTTISRDLLDAILELIFLERTFAGLKPMGNVSIIDVGAGYGRLAKRYRDCFPSATYKIVDGIPVSTVLSQVYLGRYGYADSVVPLFDLEATLATVRPDLLVNTHSFPEMHPHDITFFVRLAAAYEVRYIFIAPNKLTKTPNLVTNKDESIDEILKHFGYELFRFENLFFDELHVCDATVQGLACSPGSWGYAHAVPYYAYKRRAVPPPPLQQHSRSHSTSHLPGRNSGS